MLPCTHASKGKLAFNLKRQEVTSPSQPPAQAALTATPPLTYHLSSTLLLATCGESFALLNVSEYEQPAINRGGRSYVRCMVKASPYSPLISLSHIYIILITSTSFFFSSSLSRIAALRYCGGQSNMALPLMHTMSRNISRDLILGGKYDNIRIHGIAVSIAFSTAP